MSRRLVSYACGGARRARRMIFIRDAGRHDHYRDNVESGAKEWLARV
jgi:hypothetical protein